LDDIAAVAESVAFGWLDMQPARGEVVQLASPSLEARHNVSGLNTHFNAAPLSFAEYIEHSRKVIAQVRAGSAFPGLDKIIDGNSPFELKPANGYPEGKEKTYRRGVLLTHGLSDSPYFMRHLAAIFQANGFFVRVLLLPGHGTQPGDLLDVSWQEWVKTVEYGVDQLAVDVDEVYLGGFSAGGALSVYQSLRDQRVRGLFLFAPALSVSPKAAVANFHKAYSWLAPSAKWLSIKPDTDIYKYESFPKNAAAQMHALTRVVKKQLAKYKVEIPVFAVVSQDDATVNTAATIEFMANSVNSANKLVYYFSEEEKIPPGFDQSKIEYVNSVLSEKRISSSAHTAIVMPPDDEYYGEQGAYCNCLHYYPNDMAKYQACIERLEIVMQGEITEKNLKQGTLRRLMYNPHFENLKIAMKQFIDKLP
jgi:esterase/lipase